MAVIAVSIWLAGRPFSLAMANRDGRRSASWNPLGPQRSEGLERTTILSEAAPRGAVQEAVLAARTAGKIVGGDGFKRGGPAHRFYANSKGEMVPNSEGDSACIGSSEPRTAPQGLANIGSDLPPLPAPTGQRHTAARIYSRRMRSAVDEPQCDVEVEECAVIRRSGRKSSPIKFARRPTTMWLSWAPDL